MSLLPGARLGPYEIAAPLGAGGMGEVYRARDTKLERQVALKLVLEAFVADPDRAMRFEREAKTLAALNHPNIATLHGLEQADGRHFLVMELVEGETLGERIERQPSGLPLEDALQIARQVAEALEAAHEKGIVHRDLKPANVKITPDDKVKVLDFGLARVTEREGSSSMSLAQSPTFTSPAMTNAGVILGTASYMSPEQARGYTADHRSDVFSFGVVLYEMLTGRQPFPGETISDVLASVLVRDPDLGALPSDLSPRLIDLVKRCLEKNPKKRWQAIGDVRYEIESLLTNPRAAVMPPQLALALAPRPLWRRAMPFVLTAMGAAVLVGVAMWLARPAADPTPVTRFTIVPPDGRNLSATALQGLALSPDGSRIAYVADRQIYVRPLAAFDAVRILPTDSAGVVYNLAFSPDGQSLVYWSLGAIMRVPAGGGPPVTVCAAGTNTPFGLTWDGDSLLYAHERKILRVAATGGTPETLVEFAEGETPWRPQLLGDGRTVLFTLLPAGGVPDGFERGALVAQRIGESTRTAILESAVDGRFVAPGHLVFARQGVLFAVAFDPATLKVSGGPVPVVEGVRRTGANSQFAIAPSGALAYVQGPAAVTASMMERSLVLADRSGGREFLKVPAGTYAEPRLSRDGRTIAFVNTENSEPNIWIYDMKGTGAARRLTFGGKARAPVWSTDGTRVTFQSERDGDAAIYWQRADGSGVAERLTKPDAGTKHVPMAWSPDGEVLLFDSVKEKESALMLWRARDKSSAPFGDVRSFRPTGAVFSPDGRWVAYSKRSSDDPSAKSAVFVQPYPATGAMFQISRSVEDAHHQVWSTKGTEIMYIPGPAGQVVSIPLTLSPAFVPGEPVMLTRRFSNHPPSAPRPHDPTPDGRILAITSDARTETQSPSATPSAAPRSEEVRIVLNWIQELRAKVPTKR